jgi:replicative DNA helicase
LPLPKAAFATRPASSTSIPLLTQVVERIQELHDRDNPSDITGVPTGYHDLDAMTSGLQPGDLLIVAGRPSMGKTSFALNMAEHVAIE